MTLASHLHDAEVIMVEKLKNASEILKILNPILATLVLTLLGLVGFLFWDTLETRKADFTVLKTDVAQIQMDLAEIKGNRFRSQDGLEVWQAIADIKTRIASISASIPAEIPPQWFKDHVDSLGEETQATSRKLDTMLTRMTQYESSVVRLESMILAMNRLSREGVEEAAVIGEYTD
jgi:hypothetical protein